MKVKQAVFELGAVRPSQWPVDGFPEFAFLGRSNVGKSSLLNRLLSRKALARVSGAPGKTREINFYCINETVRFADLPGYGYAAVSKVERAKFAQMMETYLRERQPLVRVLHLIDIRHDPMESDIAMHKFLIESGLQVAVVATKMDKVSRSAAERAKVRIRKMLETGATVLPVSAEKNEGIDGLWDVIDADLDESSGTL